MIQKRRIVTALILGMVAEIINRIFPILVIRHAEQYLGLEAFGTAQFGMWLIDIAVFFITFGYAPLAAIDIGRERENSIAIGKLISETTALKIVHAALAYCGLLILIVSLPSYEKYLSTILVLAFVPITSAIDMYYVNIGTQRMSFISLVTMIAKSCSLITVLMFINDPEDFSTYAALTLGANSLISLSTCAATLRQYSFQRVTGKDLMRRFRRALPFAVTILLMAFQDRFDMFIVENKLGSRGAGIYAGPVRLTQSLMFVLSGMHSVFFAEMVVLKDRGALAQHAKVALWTMLAFSFPVMCGVWFVKEGLLVFILGRDYAQAGDILAFLSLGLFGQALMTVFGLEVLALVRKMTLFNLMLLFGSFAGIIFSFLFFSYNGIEGVALASMGSRLVVGVAAAVASWSILKMLPWLVFIKTGIPAILMAGALAAVSSNSLIVNLLVGGFAYCIFLAAFNSKEVLQAFIKIRSR